MIANNNFIVQSETLRAINIIGETNGTYTMININGNNFLKGQKAINYYSNVKTIIQNNIVRKSNLGVSSSNNILLKNNYIIR